MATEDDYLLLRFLRLHDSPCPECGYNLRNHTTGRCPECGFEVVLGVRHTVPPRRVAYDVLLIALAMPAGIGAVEISLWLDLEIRRLALPRLGSSFLTVYPILCLIGLIGAFGLRRPLAESRHMAWVLASLFGGTDVWILVWFFILPPLLGRP